MKWFAAAWAVAQAATASLAAAHAESHAVPPPPRAALYAHLAYASEGAYREITVRDHTITCRFNAHNSWMDEQEKRAAEESRRTGRTVAPPMAQRPWWTDADLVTESATLSPAEVSSLARLIRTGGFLKLAPRYPARGRSYPTTITAGVGHRPAKTVVYESGMGSKPMPSALAALRERLYSLATTHFPNLHTDD